MYIIYRLIARRVAVVLALTGGAGLALPGGGASAQEMGARPDTVEYQSGPYLLKGLVYRPTGVGPHPAVLFLHGSGADYTREVAAVGPLYAANGFLLFVPFRRGQGLSAGIGSSVAARMDEDEAVNGFAASYRLMADLLGTEQVDDVKAGLAYLKAQSDVDVDRIGVAGNSFGGILAVFCANRLSGIKAVVSSAPAALTWANAPELRIRLRAAVRDAQVPVFFVQAANDADLTPTEELAREMAAAGRPHFRKVYPAFGTTQAEGHSFGYFGGETWGPDVFAYFRTWMER